MERIRNISIDQIPTEILWLVDFLGINNVKRALDRFDRSLAFSGVVSRRYLRLRHPWWESLRIFIQANGELEGLSRGDLDGVLLVAQDALKIKALANSFPPKFKNRLIRNLLDDNRAADYLFEVNIAWQFSKRGFEIAWFDKEQEAGPEFTFLTEDMKIDVECKAISVDLGRRIHRADLYSFADHLFNGLSDIGQSGWIEILMNRRLPRDHKFHKELVGRLSDSIRINSEGALSVDDLCSVKWQLGFSQRAVVDPYEFFKDRIATKGQHGHVIILGKPEGQGVRDPICLICKSSESDELLTGIYKKLTKSIKEQLNFKRPAFMSVFIPEISGFSGFEDKTGLSNMTNRIFSEELSRHVVAISYCSEAQIKRDAGAIHTHYPAILFRNGNSLFRNESNFPFLET